MYYSRSRKTLWHKGKTSRLVQKIKEIRIDDDQDCVWLRVDVQGGASCHVGYRSCFYRSVPFGEKRGSSVLKFEENEKVFDPKRSLWRRSQSNKAIILFTIKFKGIKQLSCL